MLAELQRRHRAEDANHAVALKQAARSGQEPEDDRTPLGERQRVIYDTPDRLWANAAVVADLVDEAIEMIEAHEPRVDRRPGPAAPTAEERA